MKLIKSILCLFVAAWLAVPAFAGEISASGTISTQNVSASETCTALSCVELDVTNRGTVSVQVAGTYTGALTLQRSNDRLSWESLSGTTTFTNAAGTSTATIASGTTGTFAVANVAGFRFIRVTALAAVTGSATVTIYTSIPGGGGGGGAAGAVTNAGTFAVQESGGALTALQIMDDWDESDRAKVNIIVGQAGVAAGNGVSGVTVPRVTIASDSTGQVALAAGSATIGALTANQSVNVAQINGVTTLMGAGNTGTGSQRVTEATDSQLSAGVGATGDAAASQGGTGSISAKLREMSTSLGTINTSINTSLGYSVAVSLTRTADTNQYTAGDVLGAATGSTAALTFTAMGPASGKIMLTTVELEIDAASVISGETSYRLYLYNVTPPSALGDNAAWDLPSGDRASFLGYVDLGTPVDLISTLYVQTTAVNRQLTLASSGNLFAYLVTNSTYTPTSARVHKITLNAVAL